MKKLAVVITTHITDPKTSPHRMSNYQAQSNFDNLLFRYYKHICIGNYLKYDSGLPKDQYDIIIADTGSPLDEYSKWIIDLAQKDNNINLISIPNTGGAWAALKYFMHTNPVAYTLYENFLFHIDDGVEVLKDGWALDMITEYNNHERPGIMGRFLDTIDLSEDGLPGHRNICSHVANMWGIKERTTIPHLHGDYWLMGQECLKELADIWYDPIHSDNDMEYQRKLENMNFQELFHYSLQTTGSHKLFEDMHIGREVDTPLRIEKLNRNLFGYSKHSEMIRGSQINHRKHEVLEQIEKIEQSLEENLNAK